MPWLFGQNLRDGSAAVMHRVETLPEHRDRTLYVGNLDRRLTEYQLIKMFEPYGTIQGELFMWHHVGELRGIPRGFAFIEFSTKEEAMRAQRSTDRQEVLGRRLVVRFADEKDTDDMNIQFQSLAERRAADSTKSRSGGVELATGDKIRAIEQKLRAMQQQQDQLAPKLYEEQEEEKGGPSSDANGSDSKKKQESDIDKLTRLHDQHQRSRTEVAVRGSTKEHRHHDRATDRGSTSSHRPPEVNDGKEGRRRSRSRSRSPSPVGSR